jgi:hypothetical protein
MNLKNRELIVLGLLLAFAAATCTAANQRGGSPVIPAGLQVQVRITENLSSATAKEGQAFHGTLAAPIVVNGRTLYPKGANVTGQVVAAHPSGRLSDPGVLELVLTSVSYGRSSSPLNTPAFTIKGESHTKSNVAKIGGGTALGAIIGAMAGGGKGAAIGAGVGAAAGTGVAAGTGRKEAKVESEAVLTWRTGTEVAVAAPQEPQPEYRDQGYRDTNYKRDEDDDSYVRFSARDRRVIQTCFANNYSNLPPGLAKRDRLPPGLERQVQRNGTLPPGLQKRVQPLPEACGRQLPRLPGGWVRVVLSGRVLLLDSGNRIMDLFTLNFGDRRSDDDED